MSDKSFENLFKALESQNSEEAFREAHTLKGVALNMGMENLFRSSSEVTDALRGGKNNTDEKMLERLRTDYNTAAQAIKNLD